MSEFIYMNSCLNSCPWIHDNKIIYEFIIMNSFANSVLWRISWYHGWIWGNELTYEIMVEFINLKVFLIPLLIYIWGKMFYWSKVITTASLQSTHCKPQGCVWLLPVLCGDQAALLQRQTSRAAQSRAGRIWRALQAHDGRHWRQDQLGLLISKKGNFRNLQVQRDFSSWISRADTKYQTSWTQTFDWYILLHSTYSRSSYLVNHSGRTTMFTIQGKFTKSDRLYSGAPSDAGSREK